MKLKHVFLCTLGLAFLLLSGCGEQSSQVEYIGADNAKQLVLQASGLSETEVDSITTDLVTQDGQDCYQVDLTVEGQSYQYSVNARTGVILDAPPDPTPEDSPGASEEPAAEPEDTTEPDVQTGSTTPADTQPESTPQAVTTQTPTTQSPQTPPAPQATQSPQTPPAPQATQSPQTPPAPQASSAGTSTMITAEEAKQKALNHAGLTSSQVTFVKCKLDYEHGRQVYEIEFYISGQGEYDYDIDAYTGAVVKYDYDAEDYTPPKHTERPANSGSSGSSGNGGSSGNNGNNGTMLTADEAKAIALARVPGATASNFRDFELDRDDGRLEYEGKIVYNGMEYEFEIDAYSGTVRSWEVEPAGH